MGKKLKLRGSITIPWAASVDGDALTQADVRQITQYIRVRLHWTLLDVESLVRDATGAYRTSIPTRRVSIKVEEARRG